MFYLCVRENICPILLFNMANPRTFCTPAKICTAFCHVNYFILILCVAHFKDDICLLMKSYTKREEQGRMQQYKPDKTMKKILWTNKWDDRHTSFLFNMRIFANEIRIVQTHRFVRFYLVIYFFSFTILSITDWAY